MICYSKLMIEFYWSMIFTIAFYNAKQYLDLPHKHECIKLYTVLYILYTKKRRQFLSLEDNLWHYNYVKENKSVSKQTYERNIWNDWKQVLWATNAGYTPRKRLISCMWPFPARAYLCVQTVTRKKKYVHTRAFNENGNWQTNKWWRFTQKHATRGGIYSFYSLLSYTEATSMVRSRRCAINLTQIYSFGRLPGREEREKRKQE